MRNLTNGNFIHVPSHRFKSCQVLDNSCGVIVAQPLRQVWVQAPTLEQVVRLSVKSSKNRLRSKHKKRCRRLLPFRIRGSTGRTHQFNALSPAINQMMLSKVITLKAYRSTNLWGVIKLIWRDVIFNTL